MRQGWLSRVEGVDFACGVWYQTAPFLLTGPAAGD